MGADLGARVGIFCRNALNKIFICFSRVDNVRSAKQASYGGDTCRGAALTQIAGLPQSITQLSLPACGLIGYLWPTCGILEPCYTFRHNHRDHEKALSTSTDIGMQTL